MIEVVLVLMFLGPSWIFAALYLHFGVRPHLASPELALLNQNLSKLGLFWATTKADCDVLSEGAIAEDRRRMYRTFFFTTGLLSLFSFVGMILLILLFASGRPRFEREIFLSELTRNSNLPPADVQRLVDEARAKC